MAAAYAGPPDSTSVAVPRPAKRPLSEADEQEMSSSMPSTSAPTAADMTNRAKLTRLERPSEAFSNAVKSKLQSYTRTGQACDRCKVRKIRCDALPEGCSHCTSQKLECYVTDRISGRTERRGYLQELERKDIAMQAHIEQLQQLLQEQGVEVHPWQWSPFSPASAPETSGRPWSNRGSVWYRTSGSGGSSGSGSGGGSDSKSGGRSDSNSNSGGDSGALVNATSSPSPLTRLTPRSTPRSTPTEYTINYSSASVLKAFPTDSYIGVRADWAPVNSINGTQVSILGTLLDIDPGAESEPSPSYWEPTGLYNRSVGSFLRSYMNINPPLENVELPSRSDAIEYSEWYFLMVHPFMPVLHKPTYMTLLTRIYDDPKFRPSVSELVIVHMVFATIYYQYGVRNREDTARQMHLHDLSNKHYHWSLQKIYNLICDWSLTAVQAFVLIAAYTRAFPKPGCGSTVSKFCLMKAVDLGLHRVPASTPETTTLDLEMRKRAWWASLMMCITINGRLGRPTPISLLEFNTEMPLAIPDEYLTADGITDLSQVGQCCFLVSLLAFRFTPLFMEMFSSIYGARRDPQRYEVVVRDLDRQAWALENDMPAVLRVDRCPPNDRIKAIYSKAIILEFRLCLWHPSVCLSTDPQTRAQNTRICEDASRQLLKCVQQLLAFKSLDTTWYQMSVYCAAMFSSVAGMWERRFKTTADEVEVLQDETSIWLSIIAEISLLTGAPNGGRTFITKLTQICARSISWILHDMPHPPRLLHHGSAAPPAYASPTNADSLAIKLETEARRKLEVRMEMGATMPDMDDPQNNRTTTTTTTTTTNTNTSTSNGPYVPGLSYDQMSIDGGSAFGNHPPPSEYMYAGQDTTYGPQPVPPRDGNSGFMTDSHAAAAAAASAAVAAAAAGSNTATGSSPAVNTAANTPNTTTDGLLSNAWTDWTAAMAASSSQDRFASADALLDLSMLHQRLAPVTSNGGNGPATANAAASGVAVTDVSSMVPATGSGPSALQPGGGAGDGTNGGPDAAGVPHTAEWPLLLFSSNTGI